jgi:predicted transposase/invertase (TIGR01784 family)
MQNIRSEVFERYALYFEYVLINLSAYNDNKVIDDLALSFGLSLLKHIFDEPEKILSMLLKHKDLLLELVLEDEEFLRTSILYLSTTDVDRGKLADIFENSFPNQGRSLVMSLCQSLLEEGIEKGREEGIEEAQYKIAKQLLIEGISVQTIKKSTGLSEKEIQKLKSEIS